MRRIFTPLTVTVLTLALTACAQETPQADGLSSSSVPGSSVPGSALPGSSLRGSSDPQPDSGTATDSALVEGSTDPSGPMDEAFVVSTHARFNEGWAMAFLPGTDLLAVTERGGQLKLRDQASGEIRQVSGVPEVYHSGQAGMHDIIPGPDFSETGTVYLSWVRPHQEGAQGVVATARLNTDAAALEDLEIIWEQTPVDANAHSALRLLIQDEHLFITSGDRALQTPAQEFDTNLGKVLRLTLDGDPVEDNPWYDRGGVAAEFYTIGHRNPLGIAEDSQGNIWVSEMGPQGGDELNLLVAGQNYGWPEVSMGVEYSGSSIPDHGSDDYLPPVMYWDPSISPGSLAIYDGDLFEGWTDSALLGALSGQGLHRVQLDGKSATPAGHWDAGARIRAVDVADDGAIWVLEDNNGRLLELRPR